MRNCYNCEVRGRRVRFARRDTGSKVMVMASEELRAGAEAVVVLVVEVEVVLVVEVVVMIMPKVAGADGRAKLTAISL